MLGDALDPISLVFILASPQKLWLGFKVEKGCMEGRKLAIRYYINPETLRICSLHHRELHIHNVSGFM
jgi:hypothetical protein